MFSYCNKLMISSVQTVFKRYAGHSKWQNIRHTKAAKDMEKGLLFAKLGQRIKIAIQESGNADPVYNVKLSQAIETAKSKHMPSATIQSFITQAKKDGANAKIIWIDVRGPKGIFIILQFLTDTPQKVKNEVTNINKKFGLSIENNLRKHFAHKGIIFAKPKTDITDIEDHESVVHAIESGAEDVEHDTEENMLKFICGPLDIKKVSEKLTELEYTIEDAEDYYLPQQTVTVDDTTVEQLSKYMDKLNNVPGLIKIYDNIL